MWAPAISGIAVLATSLLVALGTGPASAAKTFLNNQPAPNTNPATLTFDATRTSTDLLDGYRQFVGGLTVQLF